MHQQWLGESQGHLIFILQDLSGIGDIFGKHYWLPHEQHIEKVATIISVCVSWSYTSIYFDPCDQLPSWIYYIDSWCLVIQYLLFIIFPPYCSEVRGHISNHIWWSTFLFVCFYHISQCIIFCSVCSHRSYCSNSPCAQVPQQSWACKIIVRDNLIIGGLHHRKFVD